MRQFIQIGIMLIGISTLSTAFAVPNPASAHCTAQGGILHLIKDLRNDGQLGICFFDDTSYCEEWAYFRGECQPSKSYPPEYVQDVDIEKYLCYTGQEEAGKLILCDSAQKKQEKSH